MVEALGIDEFLEDGRVPELEGVFVLGTAPAQIELSLFGNDAIASSDDSLGELGSFLSPVSVQRPRHLGVIEIEPCVFVGPFISYPRLDLD